MAKNHCVILSSFVSGLPSAYQHEANDCIFGTYSTNQDTLIKRLLYLVECTTIITLQAVITCGIQPKMVDLMDLIREQTRIIRNNLEAFAEEPEMYQPLAEETGRLFGVCLKMLPTQQEQWEHLIGVCENASVIV